MSGRQNDVFHYMGYIKETRSRPNVIRYFRIFRYLARYTRLIMKTAMRMYR